MIIDLGIEQELGHLRFGGEDVLKRGGLRVKECTNLELDSVTVKTSSL